MNNILSAPLSLSAKVSIPIHEIEFQFIRAQGAGGQHVNKVSSAVHLRFNIMTSSLPTAYKEKLAGYKDHHITSERIIIIKAQRFRKQEKNREDALLRLVEIIHSAMHVEKKRKATKPSRASKQRRMDKKTQQGKKKFLRGKVNF